MDLINLYEAREKITKDINTSITTMKKAGFELAKAERDYRVEKAKAIVILKADKVPATLIIQLVNGIETIADLRMFRDNAEVLYKTAHEFILVKKKELQIISDDIANIRMGV